MKRKNNKTQNTVLLQIETQANAGLIAKTSKSMLAIFARYFGLGAGFCLLIWSFIEKPVFLTGVEIGIVLLLASFLIPWAMEIRAKKQLEKRLNKGSIKLEYKWYEDFLEIYSREGGRVNLSKIFYTDIRAMKKVSFGLSIQLQNRGVYYLFLDKEQKEEVIRLWEAKREKKTKDAV